MHITTYSKVHFTPLEPKEEEILLDDIVHAQSLMTRANGHFPEFYSVAQHSIACGKEAAARKYSDRIVLACLLHDASEAYLSDITRPVKKELEGYIKMEKTLQNAIYRRFLGNILSEEEQQAVKSVDDTCLYYEFLHYMGEALEDKPPKKYSEMIFETIPFAQAEAELRKMMESYLKRIGAE